MKKILMVVLLLGLGLAFSQVSGQTIYVHTSGVEPTVTVNDVVQQTFTKESNTMFVLKLNTYGQWVQPTVTIGGQVAKGAEIVKVLELTMFDGGQEGHLYKTVNGWVFNTVAPRTIWMYNPWPASVPTVSVDGSKVTQGVSNVSKVKGDTLMCGWYGLYVDHDKDPSLLFYDALNINDVDNGIYGDYGIGSSKSFKTGNTDKIVWIHNDGVDGAPTIKKDQEGKIGQCGYAIALVVYDWSYTRDDFEFTSYAGNPNGFVAGSGAVAKGDEKAGCAHYTEATVGMVQNKLVNGLPAATSVDLCKNQKVASWFQSDSSTPTGVSNTKCVDLLMELNKDGLWEYNSVIHGENKGFFPINDFNPWEDQLLKGRHVPILEDGFEDKAVNVEGLQNFHFCSQTQGEFSYKPGQKFSFSGDDDFWLFVDDELEIDLGGLHIQIDQTLNLDELAKKYSWEPESKHSLSIFHCERATDGSNFKIQSNIYLKQSKGIICETNRNKSSDDYGVTQCKTNTSSEGDCLALAKKADNGLVTSKFNYYLEGYFGGSLLRSDTLSIGEVHAGLGYEGGVQGIKLLTDSTFILDLKGIKGLPAGNYFLVTQDKNYSVAERIPFSVEGAGGIVNVEEEVVLAGTPVMIVVGNILDEKISQDTLRYTLAVPPGVQIYTDEAMTALAEGSLITNEEGLDTVWIIAPKSIDGNLVTSVGVSGGSTIKKVSWILPTIKFDPTNAPIGEYAYLDHKISLEVLDEKGASCIACQGDTVQLYSDVFSFKDNPDGVAVSFIVLDGTAKSEFYVFVDSAVSGAYIGAEINDNDAARSIDREAYSEISNISLIAPPVPLIERAEVFDANGDGVADLIEVIFDRDITDSLPIEFSYTWPVGEIPISVTSDEIKSKLKDGKKLSFTNEKGLWKDTLLTVGLGRVKYSYSVGARSFTLNASIQDKMGPVVVKATMQIKSSRDILNTEFSEPILVDSVRGGEYELINFSKNNLAESYDYTFVGWADSNRVLKVSFKASVEVDKKPIVGDLVRISFDAAAYAGQLRDTLSNYANVDNKWEKISGETRIALTSVDLAEVNLEILKDSTPFTIVSLDPTVTKNEAFEQTGQQGVLIPVEVFENVALDKSGNLISSDSLEFFYEIRVYSHLGGALSTVSGSVSCNDPIYFNGNCHSNPRALYLQWNYQSDDGRLVGSGVYFVKLSWSVKASGSSVADDEFEHSWGVHRISEIEAEKTTK